MKTNDGANAWDAAAALRRIRRVERVARGDGEAAGRVPLVVTSAMQAAELAQERAYARDKGDVQECLTLLRQVPRLLGTLVPQVPDSRTELRRSDAMRAGRALAQTLHVALHRAWREGQAAPVAEQRNVALERLVRSAERVYRQRLMTSRSASRRQLAGPLQKLLEEVVNDTFETMIPLTRHVASLPPEVRDRGALGLRIARLGRRAAFLAAALVMLRSRLSVRRTQATTAEIATSRGKLCRHEPRLRAAPRKIRAMPGARVRLRGRIREMDWVALPEKPYTRLRLQDTDTLVYAHRKNLQRLGVQANMAVWLAGKVEEVSGSKAVVVEFEGPGQHANEYWEDWLANEVRASYDLHPQVLFMEWEYPPAGGTRISADVRARLGRRQREEA